MQWVSAPARLTGKRSDVRRACFVVAAVAVGLLTPHAVQAQDAAVPDRPATITFDANDTRQRIMGFGAQTWSGDTTVEPVLRELGLRFVRMTVGPNWPNADALPPTDATRGEMDRFLADHFDGDGEPRLANAIKSWEMTDRLGIQVIMIQFSAPENWLSQDGQRRLLSKHLDDFARYWGSLVAFMDSHDMRPAYLELSNEPEGDWNTRIVPEDYNRLVILTRKELDERGFKGVRIVGPGLAWLDHEGGAKRWIGALTPDGVDALAAWSTHTWDDKFKPDAPVEFMAERWRGFTAAIQRKDPDGHKPLFVTEYATGATTFNGVNYDPVESDGANRASDSDAYAQRVFEQTLVHINRGASVLILWEAADQPWSQHAWGMVTSDQDGGRPRPVFHALTTLMPHVPRNALALIPLSPDKRVTATGFLDENNLIVALANGTNSSQTRTLVIRNAPGLHLIGATRFQAGRTEKIHLLVDDRQLAIDLPPESTLTCRFQFSPPTPGRVPSSN
jgi:hypothetical protein